MGVGQRAVLCLTVLAAFFGTTAANGQANQWAWMGGGDNGVSTTPVYGTMGTPAPANIPAGRAQPATWTDSSGNLWMFGSGLSWGDDLWKFSPSTKQWAWMGGSGATGEFGSYGTIGVPAPSNLPTGRYGASTWVDANGNFWMFGGNGGSTDLPGILNDLWEYSLSTSEWTWIGGPNAMGSNCFTAGGTNCAGPGVYGTMGTPSAANIPPGRYGATSWTDQNGNVWLFGGWGYDVPNGTRYFYNDLWMFGLSTKQWTWMGGSASKVGSACFSDPNYYYLWCGEPGSYGSLLTSSAANAPGGRSGAMGWTDNNGKLWVFGGQGFDTNGQFDDLNDMWQLDPKTAQWTWMGGQSIAYGYYTNPTGVFGTLDVPSPENIPTTRYSAATWKDTSGNLWMFGGQASGWYGDSFANATKNDLWKFNPTTNQWAWMGGNDGSFPAYQGGVDGVYGTVDIAAPGNVPSDRVGAAAWTDTNGNFWLFGGYTLGVDLVTGQSNYDNDLWEYQPSAGPLPTTAAPTFSPSAGTYTGNQTVSLLDATNGATIYYTTDGTTPTTSSQYFDSRYPITVPKSETILAFAVASGCLPSPIATAVYTLPPQAATPTISLPSGTYTTWQTVTISEASPGATIYYNNVGQVPNATWTAYTGPVQLMGSTNLYAVARGPGYSDSNVASATYTLNLPPTAIPTFSPVGGDATFTTPQTITISDSTPNATIYYAINRSAQIDPSFLYTGPITVSSTGTVWAIAIAKDHAASNNAFDSWIINPNAVATATPSISPAPGTYSSAQTVTISDATVGANIYYTTDGSTPTTSSPPYTGPFTISSTQTVIAIASATNYLNSSVATASYTINLPTQPPPPPDFNVSIAQQTMTVTAGQSANTDISIAALNGFNAQTTFACSGLPSGASCSFSPATVTLSTGSAMTVLTVTTAPRTGMLHPFARPLYPGIVAAFGLLGIFWRKRRFRSSLLGFTAMGIVLLAGCGGSSTSPGSGGSSNPVSSTVTVTATSGTLSHAITFTLVVN